MKYCIIDGCEKKQNAKGLCPKHYYRMKTYGDPNIVRFPWREDRSCSVINCKEEHEAKGYCKSHYLIFKKFNISHDEYVNKIINQNNKCAICKNECSHNKKLSVDHNHRNNQIRGLLCASCNLALGGFKDDIKILKSAMEYLEYWKQNER